MNCLPGNDTYSKGVGRGVVSVEGGSTAVAKLISLIGSIGVMGSWAMTEPEKTRTMAREASFLPVFLFMTTLTSLKNGLFFDACPGMGIIYYKNVN